MHCVMENLPRPERCVALVKIAYDLRKYSVHSATLSSDGLKGSNILKMEDDETSAQAMQIISLREVAKQLQEELANKDEVRFLPIFALGCV